MQPNGTVNIDLTIKAWADIVLNKWFAAISSIPVIDKETLRDSLKYTLFINAGSNIERIDFSFKLYGIFVAWMYRKGLVVKKENDSDDWFSNRYYAQVMRLKEILINKYQHEIVFSMVDIISSQNDQQLKSIDISI